MISIELSHLDECANEDALAPARGVINGLILCAPFWAFIAWMIWS